MSTPQDWIIYLLEVPKALLANAKQALKLEYQKSAALTSQLQAIKTQLEQVQAENKTPREPNSRKFIARS